MKPGPKPGKALPAMSKGEAELNFQLRALGIPFEREYRFNPNRRWRADFAIPAYKILIEVEGGTWSGGRHSQGAGFEKDCEKYAYAGLDGWLVLRGSTGQVKTGTLLQWIQWGIAERGKAIRLASNG